MDVTACLVTRGNVDMEPILESLIFDRVIVWDNSQRSFDAKSSGRYRAADEAETDVVYFQDDDVLVPAETQQELVSRYQPDLYLTVMEDERNRTDFSELCWSGFGSITNRNLYRGAFQRWQDAGESVTDDAFLYVGCDVVFSILNPGRTERISLPFQHLEYAYGTDRLYRQPDYASWKWHAYEKALSLR